jgi:hypothetical protein
MVVVNKLYSEEERLEVLQHDFGLFLSEKQKNAIKGMESELKDDFSFYGDI